MKLTISLVVVLIAFVYNTNAQCTTRVLDLVIVLDESGSVTEPNYKLAKDFVIRLVSNLNVDPLKVHVGLIRYSDVAYVSRSLFETDQDKKELLYYLTNMSYMKGNTATGDALGKARETFAKFGRSDAPRVVLVLTDGYSNWGTLQVKPISDALKADNIHIYAVGISKNINDDELTYMASEPKTRYKRLLTDYNMLVSSINEITNTVCGVNAIIEVGRSVTIKTEKNEVRNFETNISKLSKSTKYLELSIKNLKGFSTIGYSFTNPNPSPTGANVPASRVETDGTYRTLYFDIPIPTGAKLFYFAVKSIGDGDNEFSVRVN